MCCFATVNLYVKMTKHFTMVKVNPHWVNTELHVTLLAICSLHLASAPPTPTPQFQNNN